MERKNPVFIPVWILLSRFLIPGTKKSSNIQVAEKAEKPAWRNLFLTMFMVSGFLTVSSIVFGQTVNSLMLTGAGFSSYTFNDAPRITASDNSNPTWRGLGLHGTHVGSEIPTTSLSDLNITSFDYGIATDCVTPPAPTGSAAQSFCSASFPTVADLAATGTAIQWYAASSGGTALPTSTALGNGSHYYASQTVDGCESTSRLDVTVTIITTPAAPTGSASQTFCSGASPTVANLTATGTAVLWYSAPGGGSSLATSTPLVNATHYYASQTVNGCESVLRFDVTVTVNTSPSAPTGSSSQTFCSGASPTVAKLTATGTGIKWYSASSGGTSLPTSTPLVNGSHYYASQTVSGCESTSRFDVTVTINTTPSAPTGAASQSFCSASSPVIADLVAVGTAIQWYSAATGGAPLAPATFLGNGNHYYASQTIGGCESSLRLDVSVTVNTTPFAPTGSAEQSFCSGISPTIADLTATGTAILWYAASSGGTSLPTSTALVSGNHYYATQTISGCESASRFDVTVTINATPSAPTGSATQSFCSGTSPAVADLTATGSSIQWYADASGGSALPPGTSLVDGTHYYATQTLNGCESILRLDVAVTVNTTPAAPTGSSSQTFCSDASPTVADLTATGSAIQWYDSPVGGTALASSTALGSGAHYYGSQTINGCESTSRFDVTATLNVTPAPPSGPASQTFCALDLPTVASLTAVGTGIQWYAASSGGTALATSTALVNGVHYYASQIVSGCESLLRFDVTVTVFPDNTINRTSAAGTTAQTVCINTAITNITYATTGATGATVTGLPAGVTGSWIANVVIISGTPTASGPFTYTVTLTGGCGVVTTTGTITVTPNNTVNRTSPAGTDAQTKCINTAITNITYATTGATGATVTGLPAGVTGSWLANVVTISGTPAASGPFTYTVTLTGGCGLVTTTGTINVTPNNTLNRTSPAGTDAQTLCINSAITSITYATTGATGATVTGLPAGVTGSWLANVVTISGTPAASGPFTYTVTLTGGCGVVTTTGTITVTPNNTLNRTSPAGTDAQTVCINSAITSITYATTGATGATITGLPAGVTGSWLANVVTISGTPTTAGPNTYTVTPTGGCGVVTTTGTINVTPNNTVNRTSPAGTDAQTKCISTPITNITYATTGATGATVTGLPAGVAGSWLANVVTISGTPTAAGPFTYTVTLTGGCGVVTTTGTINITPNNTVNLTSPAGTDAQTLCINSAITNITYATVGATGATVTGLPAGVTGSWLANVVTISGTPSVAGPFTYTVTLTGGCGVVTTTGTITVAPDNTVSLTSAAGTDAQDVCINTAITNITYGTTGATGATVTGLPAGVTGSWLANVVTISGTPTAAGPFTYTVTLTGGCGVVTTTGTINVTPNNIVNRTSPAGTDAQTLCINSAITNITYATTGATGATVTGLPAGVTGSWLANVVTISGTPAASGPFTYTVTLTGGCGAVTTTGTISVTPDNTVNRTSAAGTDAQAVCINTAITNITYATTGATGATITGLPAGVTGSWLANVVTITGTPTVTGPNTFTVTLTGGCGVVTTTGTITVSVLPAASINYTGSPFCESVVTAQSVTLTGTAGGTFSAVPGGLNINPVTGDIIPSASTPNTYTITYTIAAAGGCGIVTATAIITIDPAPNVTITNPAPVCAPLTVDLTAPSITAGSTPGLTFTYWTDALATTALANPSTLTTGIYYIKGNDPATGCYEIKPVTVTVNAVPTVTITNPAPVCTPATADLTDAAITAGSSPGLIFTYWIDALATTAFATPATATAGTYYIKGSDPVAGCYDIKPVTVTENPSPSVTTTQVNVACFGAMTGSSTATATGGTGVYTYSWNTVPVQTSVTATGLAAGTYTVTVNDGNCPATASATITEPASALSGSISLQTNVSVPGGNNGSVTVEGSGGTSPYLYKIGSGAYQASGTFGTLMAGDYTVTVQDLNLCTFDVTVTITEPATALSGSISAQTNVACFGSSTGSVTVMGSGGVPPYVYSLNSGPYQASGTFGTLPAGSYIVTVIDAAMITFDVSLTITQPVTSLSGSIISQTNILCSGGSTGSVTVAGTGGTEPYQYKLGVGSYQASGTFGSLTAGSYTVTVQDSNLCTFNVPLTLTEPAAALNGNIVTSASATCFGSSDGSITVSGSGGAVPYMYSINGGTYVATGTFTNLPSATYTISVIDANLCTTNVSVTISEPAEISVASSKVDASCRGTADGSITLTITGGSEPYSAIWSDGNINQNRQDITDGTYSVVVTDKNGCAASLDVIVGFGVSEKCLVIPDIITPNNDGFDDTWQIKNIDLFPDAEVFIFTRWGKLIFHTKNLSANPWDGTFRGSALPTDSYHYVLHLNDGSKPRSGVISIIR